MKRAAILAMALCAAPASAQTVYKCIGKSGHVTLTSEPCKASEKQAAAVYAPPERMTQERYDELERRKRKEAADSRYLESLARGDTGVSYGGSASAGNAKAARCRQARSSRQRSRDAMGMRVDYLAIRRLDEMVYDACK